MTIIAAAKAAQCESFIEKLPQGYDTEIGENGYTLSGGERQRLSIARALLINADVLICDEITSALDVTVQYEVMQLLADIKERSQTSFLFISHDIALVSNFAEDLVVLKDGIVQEKGSMREVVSAPKSDYTKLLLSQYREDKDED